mmetsp:Transcript_39357/g.91856  ORF Transcript_39357/g.91856 Transcript_39357/m.91856 type:complete len:224 (-) Transcript_39357:176-847(-)|eukprot:CAMPEP_0113316670 /NCGR_PEP_ID=MMETSP0010_2-20120614/11861_1 /TAXON_ID=216773 ORGANISM="Corethron hystrix, Strain 308" /NCGR_SAMPLE_ID=MMETSP0010_2 /ASSEMBLY_ACC=CAM_ASM_000155 /LENGTH=223 /DNA_ID=CAMNT_0000173449 /DNA_START=720 /DNA_END=1391 /DNA_ORIENTATION=- /assembly_acc=CAM_ASM_000155
MSNSSAAGMEGFDTNHFGDVTYICRASGWSVLSQSPQPSSRKQTRFINGSTSKNKSSALWNYGQKLEEERGVVVDSQGYATMFRIKKKDQTRIDTDAGFVDSILIDGKDIPDGISYSTNLGCIDFYPSISGKKNCCIYLAGRFNARRGADSCICICDDDNDLDMALWCRCAYLPSITSESMKTATESNNNGQFIVALNENTGVVGFRATEWILETLFDEVVAL